MKKPVAPKKISANELLQPDAAGAEVWQGKVPSDSAGAVAQGQQTNAAPPESAEPAIDPTRYGDWEKKGRCVDF